MTGRRTALAFGLLAALASAGPSGARSFFEDAEAPAQTRTMPSTTGVEFPLEDLVREQAEPFMNEVPGLPEGAVLDIETGQPSSVSAEHLEQFRYDAESGRFSAVAVSREFGNFSLRGRAAISVPVMMPVRRIEAGEIVTDADLAPVMMPVSALNLHVLMTSREMVGKEVRRSLMAERPVVSQSLIAPLVVKRGAAVLISLSEGRLALTSPGKSLEDGGLGQVIRVQNTYSNKTLHALVVGDGHVRAVGGAAIPNPN